MSTPIAFSTPSNQGSAIGLNTPTGTWKHPRLDEINRRQQAKTFNDGHAKLFISSLIILIGSFVVPRLLPGWVERLLQASFTTYHVYGLYMLRIVLLTNICMALLPFWYRNDDLSDIPLTPSQRALLGLKPSSAPATPGSQYVTPPRYVRSSTPKSSSASRLRITGTGSPMSGSPSSFKRDSQSPSTLLGGSGSSFSPSASPLLQKAVESRVAGRRLSFGLSNSMLGKESSINTPNTPSPGQKGSHVNLSNKWLYERERANMGRSSFGRSGFY